MRAPDRPSPPPPAPSLGDVAPRTSGIVETGPRGDGLVVALARAVGPWDGPAEVAATAARCIGEALGASRVAFADVLGDELVIEAAYVHGADPLVGRFAFDALGPSLEPHARAGRPLVVGDVDADATLSTAQRATCRARAIAAILAWPRTVDGAWVGALLVHASAPRAWSPREIALLGEAAEHAWACIDRARARAALRASEEEHHALVAAMGEGYARCELVRDETGRGVDVRVRSMNAALAHLLDREGSPEAVESLAPFAPPSWIEACARAVDTALPTRFEAHVARLDRWLDVRILPMEDDAFIALIADGTHRRDADRLRLALAAGHAERDGLRRRLSTVQEEERRRVARDLHDTVGQLLAALSFSVKSLATSEGMDAAAIARLGDLRRLADSLAREVQGLSLRLRPLALDDLGLSAALGQLIDEWSAASGVPAHFEAAGLGTARLPPDVETVLYRVVQEALTNVARHADARSVSAIVSRQGGDATAVVEDDGRGFDPDAATMRGRLGLVGMRERVALAGGRLEVESAPGRGTTIIARVPLPEPPAR